jgi:hypothetical protein
MHWWRKALLLPPQSGQQQQQQQPDERSRVGEGAPGQVLAGGWFGAAGGAGCCFWEG